MGAEQVIGVTVVAASAVIISTVILKKLKKYSGETVDRETLLEDCFGERIYVDVFTVSQAKDWIKLHQEQLNNGAKALVMKITPDSLKELGITAKISDDMNNYLTIAVVDSGKNQMIASLLIKYDTLEEKLEELLTKGNGSLVVEGG